ncbi:alpha/beta fold hydrolase [Actinomadura harenae]|uniref:alpha/beta fold hydrolase n=1 Tax=Actinomadura harenae TaxID=2483351 RepID=UPI0022793728|nr:alpha/beta hydrolase [Actinomadura harenae]
MLVPGTWMGPWIWKRVADGLRARGHSVHLVTLSGLGRDGDDVSGIGLDTHIEDVHAVLRDLAPERVVLVSHGTSGIVAGAVADREPCRVDRSVYVEASLPHDGRSAIDAFGEPLRGAELRLIEENGGRWPVPDVDVVADEQGLTDEQATWLAGRLRDHPGRPLTEPVRLTRPLAEQRATYVVCALEHFHGRLAPDVERMRTVPTWRFRTLDTGLWPMVSAPDELVALLDEIAAEVAAESGSGAGVEGPSGGVRPRAAWDTPGDEVGPQLGKG